jgi:predicted nucleotide-binding protein
MHEQENYVGTVTATNVAIGKRGHAGDTYCGSLPPDPRLNPKAGRDGDKSRHVFVIHGRDEEARLALFDFLRALGLVPMEWEHLVRTTGTGAPSLSQVVANASHEVQAVVALLTPDDIVRLHPSLHAPADSDDECAAGSQARPNVFLELGMALAIHPDRTIILEAGTMRRPADLTGLNYIRVTRDAGWCNKVATRLESAGCPVDRTGSDWYGDGRFARLAACDRRPPLDDCLRR